MTTSELLTKLADLIERNGWDGLAVGTVAEIRVEALIASVREEVAT